MRIVCKYALFSWFFRVQNFIVLIYLVNVCYLNQAKDLQLWLFPSSDVLTIRAQQRMKVFSYWYYLTGQHFVITIAIISECDRRFACI